MPSPGCEAVARGPDRRRLRSARRLGHWPHRYRRFPTCGPWPWAPFPYHPPAFARSAASARSGSAAPPVGVVPPVPVSPTPVPPRPPAPPDTPGPRLQSPSRRAASRRSALVEQGLGRRRRGPTGGEYRRQSLDGPSHSAAFHLRFSSGAAFLTGGFSARTPPDAVA